MTISRPEGYPAGASRLAVALPDPYVYRSRLKRGLAGALDALGGLIFRPSAAVPDWSDVRRVAVLRLDHLGDLLNGLPALRRLRRALPKAELDLWVGPWGAELAALFADVDTVHVARADWFQRPTRVEWPWDQIAGLGRALLARNYDVAIEPRGEPRHLLALRLAGVPARLGMALGAGGFLLSRAARWDPRLHEQEQALSLLDQAGVPAAKAGRSPYLKRDHAGEAQAAALARRLRLGPNALLIQAACGTSAKRWPAAHWAALLRRLPRAWQPVLLGSAPERAEMEALARAAGGRTAVAAGELSLAGLAAFLHRGRLLLSVDSGPAHLAALQGLPVLALYSGTNRAAQWAPRGPRVTLLRTEGVPCSPCELTACPFDNACMRALEPDTVLAALRRAWPRI